MIFEKYGINIEQIYKLLRLSPEAEDDDNNISANRSGELYLKKLSKVSYDPKKEERYSIFTIDEDNEDSMQNSCS